MEALPYAEARDKRWNGPSGCKVQGSACPTPVPSAADASWAHFTSAITHLGGRHAAQRSQLLSWGHLLFPILDLSSIPVSSSKPPISSPLSLSSAKAWEKLLSREVSGDEGEEKVGPGQRVLKTPWRFGLQPQTLSSATDLPPQMRTLAERLWGIRVQGVPVKKLTRMRSKEGLTQVRVYEADKFMLRK